jgi:LacI family transcriptional regulator
MSITMKHIAEMAEVNISTVSRALNNDPSISDEVRKKILEIAYKHDYRKRRTAKTTIAYIMDKRFFLMSSNFYNHIVESIEGEVSNSGYSFQLNLLDPEYFSFDHINLKNIAGMIITSWRFDRFIEELIKPGLPAVLVDFYQPNKNIPAILSDKIDGVFSGIEYLHSLGHRRIAYLEGDDTLWGAQDRLIGYKRAVKNFSLEDDEKLIRKGKVSIDSGYEAMKEVFKNASPPPTAVMGANDIVAIGAMIAIKEAGLSIPKDISVLGYDDVDIAGEVVPKLSTMRVDKKKMGKLAVQQLLNLIEEETLDSDKTIIKPSLVIRESTAAAPH